jgi:spermidine synthase
MSDMFTESEIALANLALAETQSGRTDVIVGGLGLGYTAQAVLAHDQVGELIVVEALQDVIAWHEAGLIPLGEELTRDQRCGFVAGDFFAMSNSDSGFDPSTPGRQFDAVLVDIDHAPDRHLAPSNAAFYTAEGLVQLQRHLKSGGIFALWSDDRPDEKFLARLTDLFATARATPVTFHNPLQDRPFTQTVYLARNQNASDRTDSENSKPISNQKI